jgi:small subunit ribosomal protein S6
MLYIVSIKFLGEEATAIEKVNALLKKFGADITKEDILGKKRLCYPIKATHQGIYVATEFDMNPANLAKLNSNLKLTPEILRHIVVDKRKKTAEELQKEQERQEKILKKTEDKLDKEAEVVEEKVEKKEKEKDKRISLDDLDVKLDEILKNDVL